MLLCDSDVLAIIIVNIICTAYRIGQRLGRKDRGNSWKVMVQRSWKVLEIVLENIVRTLYITLCKIAPVMNSLTCLTYISD